MYEIREVPYQETLDLRSKILKPFLKPEECVNPGDRREGSFSLGAFDKSQIVGIASFEIESHPDFDSLHQFRLRGMATTNTHRGLGIGKKLVLTGIEKILSLNGDFLWFNARVIAFPFYESLGFKFHGEFFELPQIGPHKVMYRKLRSLKSI